MIRPLLPTEVSLCLPGGEAFFAEAKLPGKFSPSEFVGRMTSLIESGAGIIIGAFAQSGEIQGAIAGVAYDDIYTGDRVAVEMFWFMLPEARGGVGAFRLLHAFEKWARSGGCKRCAMIHLLAINSEPLQAIYQRMGYRPVETNYLKDLLQ